MLSENEFDARLASEEKKLRRSLEFEPNDCASIHRLVNLLRAKRTDDAYEEAEGLCRRIIQIEPENVDHQLFLADLLSEQGRYSDAENTIREVTKIDAENVAAWERLAEVLDRRGKNEESEDIWQIVTGLEPTNDWAWYRLGQQLLEQGDYEGAQSSIRRAIHLNQDFWFYHDALGNALSLYGKHESSEESFTAALELASDTDDPINMLGNAARDISESRAKNFERQDKYPEAETAWRAAIEVPYHKNKTDNFERMLHLTSLGINLAEQNKFAQAETVFREALSLGVDDDWVVERARIWVNLGFVFEDRDKLEQAENAYSRALILHPYDPWPWYFIAKVRLYLSRADSEIVGDFRQMSLNAELAREESRDWYKRHTDHRDIFELLVEAADYFSFMSDDYPSYKEDAFKIADQLKARALAELLAFDPNNLREILNPSEVSELNAIDRVLNRLNQEDYLNRVRNRHSFSSLDKANLNPSQQPEISLHQRKREEIRAKSEFFGRLLTKYPQLEKFVHGPGFQKFELSVPQLQQTLEACEGVISTLVTDTNLIRDADTLLFLVTENAITHHCMWGSAGVIRLTPGQVEWQNEVKSTLHIGEGQRADGIKRDLTPETLARWGELLYGPFIDDLKDIKRLWISPHSFLTQLPFNAIPFPDGIEREVAIIPSAASLTRPASKGPRPKPRFTLGVVAADAVEQAPLNLQSEEVRHLRGTVKSAKHRWELAGSRVGEEPTLANIQDRAGLTRCLVLSCHGDGPNQDWGTLFLGSEGNSEPVTGRQLVDSLLLGGRLRNMEVDLVITSACLTGQVDLERAEEWLGLPMALQSVWKTKAMLLTLWEVEELPAMIWVVELVKALTQGLSAGQAQKIAQEKVKTVTKGEIEALWLAEAQRRLPEERWRKVDNQWRETSRSTSQYPFSEPVHWAPFILVGDPKVTVSPKR